VRAETNKEQIFSIYNEKIHGFLNFVLSRYELDVGELNQDQLHNLLEFRYKAVSDAAEQFGVV
jgi:hypothetical protein